MGSTVKIVVARNEAGLNDEAIQRTSLFSWIAALTAFARKDVNSKKICSPFTVSFSLRPAFTLAEVLITLGIIGVVAAMTIPALINNYQKTQYVTQLKKAYTQFNQVLMQISSDKGCVGDLKCTGLFSPGTTSQTLGVEFVKYYSVVKNCDIAVSLGCFSRINYSYDGLSASFYNADLDSSMYKFITSDGVSISLSNSITNCTSSNSAGKTNNMTQWCGVVYFDVNGPKKPNNFGRDVFQFYMTNGKGPILYPRGGIDDGLNSKWNPWGCSTSNAWGCSGRIMEENWKMNY